MFTSVGRSLIGWPLNAIVGISSLEPLRPRFEERSSEVLSLLSIELQASPVDFFLPRTRHVESQPVPQGRAPAWNSLCHSWPGDIWRHCAHLKTVPGKVNVNIGLKTHTPGLRHIETITVYKLPSLYNVLQVV